MRSQLLAVLTTTVLVCACSTISTKQTRTYEDSLPPMGLDVKKENFKENASIDLYLEKILKDTSSDATRWWVRFQQGKLWSKDRPDKACSAYLAVSAQPQFPLRHVAELRAMEVCPVDPKTPVDFTAFLNHDKDPWLEESLTRVALKRAVLLGDKNWEMKLSATVAKFERLQREKLKLLTRAHDLAEELKENELSSEFQNRLYLIAPRLNPQPEAKDYLGVALDFRQDRNFEQALLYFNKVRNNADAPELEKLHALEGIRQVYKLENDTEKRISAARDVMLFSKNLFRQVKTRKTWVGRYLEGTIQYARTLWNDSRVSEAVEVLKKLEKEVSPYASVEDILLMRARIEEEAGRFDQAVAFLDRAVKTPQGNHETRMKSLWYRAWNMKKGGHLKEAMGAFEDVLKNDDNSYTQLRDHFWLGKTALALKDDERSKQEFNWLIQNDPLGYYGLISYRELGLKIPPTLPERRPAGEAAVPHAQPSAAFAKPDDALYIEWLISVGENEIGRRFLDQIAKTIKDRTLTNENSWREFLQYYARTGNYQSLFNQLGDFPAPVRNQIFNDDPSLLFPQPHSSFVGEASKRHGVAPELIYAIMRQESSFNPEARSSADAFGLMQLIPSVAKSSEQSAGIHFESPEDLYIPEINIELGSSYLRELLDRYKEQFIMTVASYNASEKAIRGWIKSRYRGDVLEFIEDIPYEETRGYVKLVLRNFIFYTRLNSGGQPVEFPEWCLENLHDINL